MDHHVHRAVSDGLRDRGVDVLTTQEDGTATLDDEKLFVHVTGLGRVLFSQDDDLLVIANRWRQEGREFAGLVYGHQLALTIGQAVRDLELIASALDPEDMRNHIEFLPL